MTQKAPKTAGVSRTTTRLMPALMMSRRHMEQQVVPRSSSPVAGSLQARYRVAPSTSRREAEMMALASAWTERHSSYRSPEGMFMASRVQ